MKFTCDRTWRGPIKMDFGRMAPAVVFRKVFEEEGVPTTLEEDFLPSETN